jgi:hypothetical protein
MADIIIQTYKQHPNLVTAGLVVAGITGGLLGVSGISLILSSGVSMPGLNVIRDTLKPWGEGLAGGGALLLGGFTLVGTILTGIKIWRHKEPAPEDDVEEIDNTPSDPYKVYTEWRSEISQPSADAIKLTQNALNSLISIILNSKEEKVIVKALGLLRDLQNRAFEKMTRRLTFFAGVETFKTAADLIRIEEHRHLEQIPTTLKLTNAKERAVLKQIAYARAYGWTKLNNIAGIDRERCIAIANKHLNWINDNFHEETPALTDENVAETLRSLEDHEPMATLLQPVEEEDLAGEDRD